MLGSTKIFVDPMDINNIQNTTTKGINKMTKRTIMRTYTIERVQESSHMYNLPNNGTVRSPDDVAEVFTKVFKTENMLKEHFMMASLNTKNKVVAMHIVHVGSLNISIVHPREVFQHALLDNAASIIVCHNHPSGETTPSQEDINITKRLVESGKIIGIELLDHIILGDNEYTSLKERGYL